MNKVKFRLNGKMQLKDGILIKDLNFAGGYKISYDNNTSFASLMLIRYFKME